MTIFLSADAVAALKKCPKADIQRAVKSGELIPDAIIQTANGKITSYGFTFKTANAWEATK